MKHSDALRAPRRPAAMPPSPDAARLIELKAHCAELIERSILTLRAMPDPDARFLYRSSCGLPTPVIRLKDLDHEARLALKAKAPPWRPTTRDVDRYLTCLGWLTWLEQQPYGERDVKIIVMTTYKVPTWKIAQRYDVTTRTIDRWRDAAYLQLTVKHWQAIEQMR